MKIAVIGSINMDMIFQVKRLPQKGETLLADHYRTVPGGKGANQAVAAARLGADVTMIGALGKDGFGDQLMEHLNIEKVNTEGVMRTETPSGNASITIDKEGHNTIMVYPGANYDVTEKWIDDKLYLVEDAEWVMFQLETPLLTVEYGIKRLKALGKRILLNPAPAQILPDSLYPLIDIITPNETELSLLSGVENTDMGVQALLKKGVNQVVVTLGEKGSIAVNEDKTTKGKPFAVHAIDTTAAGDTFNAALLIALMKEKSMTDALSFANAAGALATTKMGAQSSLPTDLEVQELIKKGMK
ncbi:ribokinase [Tindallia californiensis]|uniref:Ribokinase n=1 Tax=Tindallia californiensis TaxID=159292 RepID=A0A1H3I9F0_9FIRM|nr:ribokinase [Tindallia californiensis]SDY23534.1 ribokinase [Tindallia californiensis]